MSQSPNDSNGSVFLLIHDVIGQIDEKLGENFEDELRLEVFGRVGHDHRECFFEAMEESFFIVTLSEVNGQPMCDSFIV